MRIRIHHYLVALSLWAFSMTSILAQNGQFDVRFTVKSFSCDSSKAVIAVQVRSHDMAHTFLMGDANYRFEYDPRLITTPKIVSQEHFSNIAPASDVNYSPQNLNGSSVSATLGIVSLNTFYTGVANGARLVDTAWTTVSCISFNVKAGTNCFPLVWHDNNTFPITGMNEVELLPDNNFNLYVANAGGIFANVSACFSNSCGNIKIKSVVRKQLNFVHTRNRKGVVVVPNEWKTICTRLHIKADATHRRPSRIDQSRPVCHARIKRVERNNTQSR